MSRSPFLRLAWAILVVQGCGDSSTTPTQCTAPGGQYTFSFEQGLEGWTPEAADTGSPGSAYAPWSIRPTTDLVCTGQQSLRLQVDNYTDAAKIWIVRAFAAEMGGTYAVDVSYAFGTADWGNANLWDLRTGATATAPVDGASFLAATVHDETGNGATNGGGYLWLRKSTHVSVRVGASGYIYVIIGIWGTWEAPRRYYLDDVAVTLTPR